MCMSKLQYIKGPPALPVPPFGLDLQKPLYFNRVCCLDTHSCSIHFMRFMPYGHFRTFSYSCILFHCFDSFDSYAIHFYSTAISGNFVLIVVDMCIFLIVAFCCIKLFMCVYGGQLGTTLNFTPCVWREKIL